MNQDFSRSIIVDSRYPHIPAVSAYNESCWETSFMKVLKRYLRSVGILNERSADFFISTPEIRVDVRVVVRLGMLCEWFWNFSNFSDGCFLTPWQILAFLSNSNYTEYLTVTDYGTFFPCKFGNLRLVVSTHNGGRQFYLRSATDTTSFRGGNYNRIVTPSLLALNCGETI